MKRKRFSHSVKMTKEGSGARKFFGKKVSPEHNNVSKGSIRSVYDRFYRDQVSELYKAVMKND